MQLFWGLNPGSIAYWRSSQTELFCENADDHKTVHGKCRRPQNFENGDDKKKHTKYRQDYVEYHPIYTVWLVQDAILPNDMLHYTKPGTIPITILKYRVK